MRKPPERFTKAMARPAVPMTTVQVQIIAAEKVASLAVCLSTCSSDLRKRSDQASSFEVTTPSHRF